MSQNFWYPPTISSGSTTVTANQGSPNTIANGWPVKLTDGTDTADITAASALKVDGSAVTQPVSLASLPLPTGAATSALQTTGNSSLSSIDGKLNSLGQKAMAASVPVTIASDQSALAISAVSLPLPTGAATEATLSSLNGKVTAVNTGAVVVSSSALPSGASTEATLSTLNGKIPSNLTVTSTRLLVDGSGVTQPVSIAATVATKETVSASSSVTSVASSASSVSLLASNANRLGATFYNDSTQILYLKLGATASATSYTVQLAAGSYYELPTPHLYTGAIDGIWASANGNARITELS